MARPNRLAGPTIRALWTLASRLTPEQASALGAGIVGRIGPRTRKHRMVLDNLRTAFPDWPEARIAGTARASWAQFGRVLGEFPHLSRILDPASGLLEIADPEDTLAAMSGRPAIMTSGHFANWELLAGAATRLGLAFTVVHAARADPTIEELVGRHREALGCEFLEQGESVHAMMRAIRAGRSIGVLVDQRYDAGDLVPFFGRDATAPLAPAVLAARLGLPFIPTRCERIAPCRFRITVEPPLLPDSHLGDWRAVSRDLMTRLYARFECWIRERPDEWLCIKRRWPRPDEATPGRNTASDVVRPRLNEPRSATSRNL